MATVKTQRMLTQRAYWLPNLLTTFNLSCGLLAIVLALQETWQTLPGSNHPEYLDAAWLILAAMVFDYLDGKVARWAHATSDFGMKVDSLTDFVSFGVAPFILVYRVLLPPVTLGLQVLAGGAFLAAGAWRLARFNCEASEDSNPRGFFTGLPIPAGAAFLCVMVLIYPRAETSTPLHFLTRSLSSFPPEVVGGWATLMLLLLSFLMVSRIEFPAFKHLNQRNLIVLGGAGLFFAVLLLVLPLSTIAFLVMLIYLLFGLFQHFIGRVLRLQTQAARQGAGRKKAWRLVKTPGRSRPASFKRGE